MSFGNWKVNITDKMPQKVASAMAKLDETLIGASYEFIAYIGSQVVNGTNHAVLAKQTVLSGRDTANLVLMIFNEKPNDMNATLVNIERIIEGGSPLGGTQILVKKELDEAEQDLWTDALEGYVGAKVEPIMLLATKVTKGTNYVFLAKLEPVTLEPEDEVALVTINGMTNRVMFGDLLESKHDSSLGYAFTW